MFLRGHFLLTCSDIFDIHNAQCQKQTGKQTDNIMMPIADHIACSKIS